MHKKRFYFFGIYFLLILLCVRPLLAEETLIGPEDSDSEVFHRRPPIHLLYSEETFFTANRSLQYRNRVTDNVTVITREELDRWPVSDLDEALGLVTGIVIQDDGHMGQVATAQIYGSKASDVRVMVDGITFNATTTGGIADISQIPLDMVEKIEIIKGASSSLWGSAMGGVINIITRPVGESWIPKGNLSLSFGEYGTQRERGEVWGLAGPLKYYAFGSYGESGGFRPHSDVLEKRSLLKGEIPLGDNLALAGSFGYSGTKNSEFELPALGLILERKVYSRYGNAGLTWDPAENFHGEVFYKISERSFRRNFRLLPRGTLFRHLKARSMIHEVSTRAVWDINDDQSLVFGSDVKVEVLNTAAFQMGNTLINDNKNSTEQAYYANYQLSWRFLDVTLGSRIDSANSYGQNFDPSAGFVIHFPVAGLRARANVSRAFNAPSLVDRYVSVGATVANPDLKAERAIAYNLGLEAEPAKWFHTQGTFFQTFLEDSIQTVLRDDGLRQPKNIGREERTGFEAEVKLGPWHGFSTSYGAVFVHASNRDSGPAQERPRLTHDLKLNYAKEWRGFRLNAHLAGRYMDLVTYNSGGFTDPIDQAFIFDGKLILAFPEILYGKFSVFLEGENLLNEDFSFDGGRDPNPQRNFEAGVRYEF